MKFLKLGVLFVCALVAYATISCTRIENLLDVTNSDEQPNYGVLLAARQVIEALDSQDSKKLASLVHPEKGVRFSPVAYVDVTRDVIFSRAQIEMFWTDNKIYIWGLADGTGDPISMTPSQYYREYIMTRDFLRPSSINVNNDQAAGNTSNNAASVYPNGTRVEYYIEPSVHADIHELDWAALRLVFEKSGDTWFLVAVIHDEWTT